MDENQKSSQKMAKKISKTVKVFGGASDDGTKENKLIMLVDDEQSILIVAERMLRFLGFNVLTASDGYESLALFKEHADEIDCVLLDLGLPTITGEEVLDSIRRLRPDVKVIVCSGRTQQDVRQRIDETERLVGFLQKPYTLKSLEEKLLKVM